MISIAHFSLILLTPIFLYTSSWQVVSRGVFQFRHFLLENAMTHVALFNAKCRYFEMSDSMLERTLLVSRFFLFAVSLYKILLGCLQACMIILLSTFVTRQRSADFEWAYMKKFVEFVKGIFFLWNHLWTSFYATGVEMMRWKRSDNMKVKIFNSLHRCAAHNNVEHSGVRTHPGWRLVLTVAELLHIPTYLEQRYEEMRMFFKILNFLLPVALFHISLTRYKYFFEGN